MDAIGITGGLYDLQAPATLSAQIADNQYRGEWSNPLKEITEKSCLIPTSSKAVLKPFCL
jgi:hypothetical protein